MMHLLSLLVWLTAPTTLTQAYVSVTSASATNYFGLRSTRLTSGSIGSSSATRLRYVDDCQSGSEVEPESSSSMPVALPSLEQLTKDSFTDQAYYAATLVDRLAKEESKELGDLLTAQLSHRDGMRGFLAVYLTHENSPVDLEKTPAPLIEAMKAVDMEQLAPLACMNVIRPSAMAAWHTDPVLRQNSLKTAERAKKFLASCRSSINTIKNIQAVYAVASESVPNNTANNIEQFWINVLKESRYDEDQRKAIAAAFSSFIQD